MRTQNRPPEDLEQKALRLIRQGKTNEAEKIYKKLISGGNKGFAILSNLAAIYLLKGRHKQSELFARKALKIKPDHAKAHHCLGNALRKQGKHVEAINAFKQAIQLDPGLTQAYNNLGLTQKSKGEVKSAIESFRKAISLDSRYSQAINNLGLALKDNGQLSDAIDCYKKALDIDPKFAEAQNNLGVALKDKGHHDNAIRAFELALELKPNYVAALNNLGIVHRDLGQLEEALGCHRRALDINPKNANTLFRIGRIQRNQGNLQVGKKTLKQALKHNPNHSLVLHILSTDIEDKDEAQELITASKKALKSKLGNRDKAMINFCLANCFHKLEEYTKASSHLASANELKLTYMPSNLENRLAQAAHCTAESSKIQKSNNHDGIGRIFIVGVPRCGSTLLETILANHPSIFELGETEALKVAVKRVYETGSKEEPMSLSEAYEAELSSDARKSTFTVDKNLYNYLRVGYIAKAMPAAKIIHCCRNPLDNILSMLRSNLRSGNDYTSDPIEAAKLIINHQKLMNSNKIDFPDQIFTFNYDEFTASPEVMIKPLIDWLGVEWNDDYLSPEQNKRVVTTASVVQVRKPISNKSVGGWKNYKELLQPAERVLAQSGLYNLEE